MLTVAPIGKQQPVQKNGFNDDIVVEETVTDRTNFEHVSASDLTPPDEVLGRNNPSNILGHVHLGK
jgi:hypothetical protein